MSHTGVIRSGLVEIKTLSDKLLEEAEFRIDCDHVRDILTSRTDMKYATQLILARHWSTATADSRDRAVRAFETRFTNLLCDAIYDLTPMNYEIIPYQGDPTKKRTTAKTTMMLYDGTKVPVNYGLVNRDQGCWYLFDITIEGISYVRNFNAEFNAMIGDGKTLDEWIRALNAD